MAETLVDGTVLSTRERIIDAAGDLFDEFGFSEVGLDQILARAEVSKTTFYKYLESFEDLQRASVERRGDQWLDATQSAARKAGDGDPTRMIHALVAATCDWILQPGYKGCYFIRACSEFPTETDPRHRAALFVHQRFEELVVQFATAAGIADPVGFAQDLNIALSGAIVCEAMGKPGTTAERLKRVCELLFRAHGIPHDSAPQSTDPSRTS